MILIKRWCMMKERFGVMYVKYNLIIPLCEVNVCLLANKVGEPATATLNGGKSVHNLTLTLNVGVLNTKNVLEVVLHYKGPLETAYY
jgi:hypothetical protein